MLVYMQVEYRLLTTYLGVLIRFWVSLHVQIFVQSRSDKRCLHAFYKSCEVLFIYLPDYDSPCIRAECNYQGPVSG